MRDFMGIFNEKLLRLIDVIVNSAIKIKCKELRSYFCKSKASLQKKKTHSKNCLFKCLQVFLQFEFITNLNLCSNQKPTTK